VEFKLDANAFSKSLSVAMGATDPRANLPILANFKLTLNEDGFLHIVASDLEVEIMTFVKVESWTECGSITLPAKKLLDIIKNLTDLVDIQIINAEKNGESQSPTCTIKSKKSRFKLQSMPSEEFPSIEHNTPMVELTTSAGDLTAAINRVAFAMANNDVRYYLNGALFQMNNNELILVATDGHRLAKTKLSTAHFLTSEQDSINPIVPRKGILEIAKIINSATGEIKLGFTENHLIVSTINGTLTTKLIDGRFPDWNRVIPRDSIYTMKIDRLNFKAAVNRVAVLSNEKYRGLRMTFSKNQLELEANNPEQESGEDHLDCECNAENMVIGLNVAYLNDALTSMHSEECKIHFSDQNTALRISVDDDTDLILMPLRL
jgi:DNA polymerase III subunit beta